MSDKPRSKFADYVSPNVYDGIRPMTPEDAEQHRHMVRRALTRQEIIENVEGAARLVRSGKLGTRPRDN